MGLSCESDMIPSPFNLLCLPCTSLIKTCLQGYRRDRCCGGRVMKSPLKPGESTGTPGIYNKKQPADPSKRTNTITPCMYACQPAKAQNHRTSSAHQLSAFSLRHPLLVQPGAFTLSFTLGEVSRVSMLLSQSLPPDPVAGFLFPLVADGLAAFSYSSSSHAMVCYAVLSSSRTLRTTTHTKI